MIPLTHHNALRHALDIIYRRAMSHPTTTSDHLLCLADYHSEVALDDRLTAAERALWHAAAERLRSAAPIYAGRALLPGCPAGLGGE